MLRDLKEFAFRGNLVDVAVAFVLGVAFAAVVTSLVDDVIMQAQWSESPALVTFLIIAFVLFLIVKTIQRVMPQQATTRDCPHCVSQIPVGASACAYCTRDVTPQARTA